MMQKRIDLAKVRDPPNYVHMANDPKMAERPLAVRDLQKKCLRVER
jgi:hypothetical protein